MTIKNHIITDNNGRFLKSWSCDSGQPPQWTWTWVDVPAMASLFDQLDANAILSRSGMLDRFSVIEYIPQPIKITQPIPPAPKVMEYEIISGLYLSIDVTQSLAQGWRLYGAPFSHDGKIVQAMVREKPPETA